MIYYTETLHYDHDTLMNALSKGRDDYFEMLRRMGMSKIAIPSIRPSHHLSLKERLLFERRLTKAWKKALRVVRPGDTLVIHSPNSDKFMAFAGLIKRLHAKGVRIVLITFELETFFVMEYEKLAGLKRFASKRTEAALFNTADSVVVHNDVMKRKLGSAGFDTSKMFSVGVMDYLRDEPLSEEADGRFDPDKPVVFAGDLAQGKSGFIYDLPEGLECDLYGANYTGQETELIKHRGVYDPLTLMDVMEGSFGLVWDGDSSDGCSGAYGYYLSFNNPHKIALYLASGMPVIVWSGAAMAEFVKKEGCGLIVDSLREVPGIVESLSDDEYEQMRLAACRVGNDMRQGVHIRAAVEKAICYLENH